MLREKSRKQRARALVRDNVWPSAELSVWPLPGNIEKGWAPVPRTLPLILEVLSSKAIAGGVDLARPYLGLFCANFGDGVVEVVDEEEMALGAGLAKRTWLSRIRKLEELGFIKIAAKGSRAVGYILMLHPVAALRALRLRGSVDDGVWTLFCQRHAECGATEPPSTEPPTAPAQAQEAS